MADLSRREASRKAQNERRKLQRRLANELNKSSEEKVDWKSSIQKFEESEDTTIRVRQIYNDYQKLVAKKDGYEVDVQAFSRRLADRYPNRQTQKRKNKMFEHDINKAGTDVSNISRNDTHGFYAATKFAWDGSSNQSNRNQAIMDAFGIDSLEDIYKLITEDELNYQDFDFDSEEEFLEWLDEISENIGFEISTLREIYLSEMAHETDVAEEKYNKAAMENIINRIQIAQNA